MKNFIKTKMIPLTAVIITIVVVMLLVVVVYRTDTMLEDDSDEILLSAGENYAHIINQSFISTEQSVSTIYNYALKLTESYPNFLSDKEETDAYTAEIAQLGKSIAENTDGAMAVYFRYNPVDFEPTAGFWYTYDLIKGVWEAKTPTDISVYRKNDLEHVGWYYTPIEQGTPIWMEPYYNANMGVHMISYIIPYFQNGYPVGVIGMDISMESVREAVENVHVYESGAAFLVEKDGTVIYHFLYPDGAELGELSVADQRSVTALLRNEYGTALLGQRQGGPKVKLVLEELENGMILGVYAPVDEIGAPQIGLISILITILVIVILLAGLVFIFSVMSQKLGVMSESLQEQIDAANAANIAKSHFLANMSHEIRTPINAILGMDEMIIRESNDGQIQEYATNIKLAGKALLAQVNGILDYSKLEDGKMEIIPVEYDLASLINSVVTSVATRAKS
jgi:uncharacterized membrane protein